MPKLAQHRAEGILYNGWCGHAYIFTEADVLLCPPADVPRARCLSDLMSCLASGAKLVMPSPQGFRGAGVMHNFWKLVARHRATFFITVPTAGGPDAAPVDADVTTLRLAISGSAAMPVETLFTGSRLPPALRCSRATA